MPRKIDSLKLEHFRGATCPVTIDFDTSKSVSMIYGENGTGKSSVVDALDFVCNEAIGSLSERSSVSAKSHLPALGKGAADLKVTITSAGQSWHATWEKGAPAASGPTPRFRAQILRRAKILETVNHEPKKRYEALRAFIEVPNIERCENALRDLNKTLSREYDDASKARANAEQELKTIWEKEGKQGGDYIKWAAQLASSAPADIDTRIKELRGIIRQIESASSAHTRLQASLKRATDDQSTLASEEKQLGIIAAKTNTRRQELVDVLQSAKQFFAANSQDKTCPVCEQGIDPTAVKGRIDARLTEMQELVEATARVQSFKTKASSSATMLQSSADNAQKDIKELLAMLQVSKVSEIQAKSSEWSRHSKAILAAGADTIALEKAMSELLTAATTMKPIVESRISADEAALHQQGIISTLLNTLKQKAQTARDLEKIVRKSAALLAVVEKQRKSYVEGILASISADVESMYTRIHPNEGLGGIKFHLRPNVQGSLEFDGVFQGTKDVPPQAYYSDAHMDTLGICVFLAMAKLFNDENTVVILDDVVTSADQAHMDRFMNTLHDEVKHFNQLIVTTHYRPWRDRYRFARGPAAQVQLIELLHWSVPRGIRHTRTRLCADELADHAKTEPIDGQIVSSKAGILLESLLDHLALLYECRLPRKPEPNYTLGDLLDCIGKKLRQSLKAQSVDDSGAITKDIALEPLLNDIAGMTWIRNQVGCHWNIAGLGVPDADIKTFAEKTLSLAQELICENCGELPRKSDSGIYWGCRCGHKRLHPLQNPD